MKYIILLPLVATLSSCGITKLLEDPVIQEKGMGLINAISRGDTVGVITQSVDVMLILLGLKGLQKGGQKITKVMKERLVNPKQAGNNNV